MSILAKLREKLKEEEKSPKRLNPTAAEKLALHLGVIESHIHFCGGSSSQDREKDEGKVEEDASIHIGTANNSSGTYLFYLIFPLAISRSIRSHIF